MITSLKKLIDYAAEGDVFLYGAGKVAGMILDFYKITGQQSSIKALFVTLKHEEDISYKNDRVVLQFDKNKQLIEGKRVIIATTEKYHKDILFNLQGSKCADIEVVSDRLMNDVGVFIKYAGKKNGINIPFPYKHLVPMRQLKFSVHLCEHCNLNCAGCNNFAPLANEEYTDINEYQRDMQRLSYLSGKDAYLINLTGGEPLLNKNAAEFGAIARECFPNARIALISNGILVKSLTTDFWKKLRDYEICLDLTPYPIDIDYKELVEFIHGKGIESRLFSGEKTEKVWTKEKLRLKVESPASPATENWIRCYKPNDCIQLKHGKLACTTIQCAKTFKKFYKNECKSLYFSDRDYIDIYDADDIEEIFDFLSKPFPFCRYCVTGKTEVIPWSKSMRNIGEWT